MINKKLYDLKLPVTKFTLTFNFEVKIENKIS